MNAVRMAGGPVVVAARWVARGSGVVLFLFWGSFFVHHLSWFTDPDRWPPMWVFAFQGLHLLMLAGLVVGWRWELLGGALVLLPAAPFFVLAAGPNAPLFFAVTAVPAVLWLYCAWRAGRGR
jgi:hypothetical protein